MTFRSVFCSLKQRIKVQQKSAPFEPLEHAIRRLIKDDKQERLIDGVAEYGSALAKDNKYTELAKQMDNKVGIDESIESFVKLPEPERTRESRSSRDWDIEL